MVAVVIHIAVVHVVDKMMLKRVTLGLDNASVAPSTIVFTTDAWQRLAE